MSLHDILAILTIFALVIGPIAAIQAQKLIEKFSEKRNRKLNVYTTLMATRGARLSFEHVRALNMIDTVFYGDKNITNSWKSYLDCLCEQPNGESAINNWFEKKESLFVDLLSEMAKFLGYDFDSVHLKKAIYIPKAHGQEEEYQLYIRDNIKKLFKGEQSIPIQITNLPTPPDSKS
jgi:hypothetical protein